MKKNKKIKNSKAPFWAEGSFAETVSSNDMKKKMKTIQERPDDPLDFNCKQCNTKISAHNKDWHAGMCDDCFNKKYFPDTIEKR